MTLIPPTIGRVILVHRFNPDLTPVSDQPEPALVTYVHSGHLINVGGFDTNSKPFGLTSLTLVQEGDALPAAGDSYATWMPYQLQSAANSTAQVPSKMPEVLADTPEPVSEVSMPEEEAKEA